MDNSAFLRTEYRVQYKIYNTRSEWIEDISHEDYAHIRDRCNALYKSGFTVAVRVLLVSTVVYKEMAK